VDTVDRKTRSRIMASVGQRDTGPEMLLRRELHRIGLRYRLHERNLPGSPDLVFPRFRAVLFVHGCFWHAHEGCKFAKPPSTRVNFWAEKFEANVKRDKSNNEALFAIGWRVLLVWECAIKKRYKDKMENLGLLVATWLNSGEQTGEIAG
jgi:DNA mismatch endonuclease, patch repair protein